MTSSLERLQKQKRELLNLKEALLMIKFLTVFDPEIALSKSNEKVLTLFKKTKTR